jgi:hypothetical protein
MDKEIITSGQGLPRAEPTQLQRSRPQRDEAAAAPAVLGDV